MTDRSLDGARWSADRARRWADAAGWLCGCNYLPSTAVNFVEMWRAETFDPETIDRELGWAGDIGMNAVRVNLPFVLWRADPRGLEARFERFLAIVDARSIRAVPCLFDDCEFSGAPPEDAPQPQPIEGVHNSRAVGSPGRAALLEPELRPALRAYVRQIIGRHRDDPRVVAWDLYNEPGNRMEFDASGLRERDQPPIASSLALMEAAFDWARAVEPSQPLTVAAWRIAESAELEIDPMDRRALELSDIASFHAYLPPDALERVADRLEAFDRPLLCTEWMARAIDARIENTLPILARRRIGAFQWGLARGRSQTHLPWPRALIERMGGAIGAEWFHDLLEPDGAPYSQSEVECYRALTDRSAR